MRMLAPAGAAVDLDAVDLTDPRLHADGDPHAVFAALRAHDHLHWQPVGDTGFWSVARHADAAAVLGAPEVFTSERGTLLTLLGRDDPAGRGQMAVTDPPLHGDLRRPIGRPLRAAAVREHEQRLRGEVRTLLAPARDGETLDFARAMMSLSTAVAGLVMGLPESDWPDLTRLATTAIAPDDADFAFPGGREATLTRAHRELFAYFQDEVARRERTGIDGPDLITVLRTIRSRDGRPLPPGQITSNCYSLLMGASVTTPHVPTSTLLRLLETGGYRAWAADPDRLGVGLEESLRWSSPANHFMRYATRDTEIAGTRIRAGDAVVVWIGSANRDERVFADPYTFNLTRRPNPHLAFGAGPHYCVGHHAARQSLRLVFEELSSTFTDIEAAGPARHLCSTFVAGIKSLPIRASTVPPRASGTRVVRRQVATSPWLRREPSRRAAARLFCLPYSGCGATMYRHWPEFIGSVEVLPVQPPGRESRFGEPHYGTVERLADQLVDGLAGYLDRPFAFFGHCGSALPAYEVSVRLVERGLPAPANLFVSSQVAPHQGPYGRFLELADDELRQVIRDLATATGGELIDDVLELYLEVLRADLEANRRYRRPAVWLSHPITAIGWDQDTEVEPHLMTGWAECGPTRFAVLPGPHYTFLRPPARLRALIADGLGCVVAAGGPA